LIAGYGIVVVDNLHNSHWEALTRVHWIAQQDYKKRGRSINEVPPLFFHEIDIRSRDAFESVFETWKEEEMFPRKKKSDKPRAIPKDIGAIALKEHYQCKDFQVSSTQSILENQRFDRVKITNVIHFAALKSVGESVSKPLSYYRTNVAGLINLLELMQEYKVKRVVFSSSAVVYGKGKELNISEDSVQVGGSGVGGGLLTNPYGRSKWMDEEILNDCTIADPTLDVIALRYFNPTGSHPSGLIGEDPRGTPNNIIPVVLQAFQRRRSKVQVFGSSYDTPDGTGVRDYIHVIDLARGHLAALRKLGLEDPTLPAEPLSPMATRTMALKQEAKAERRQSIIPETRPNYRCYNLGTGQGHSVLEILSAFGKVCGSDIPFVLGDARAGDLGSVTADVSKATTDLGWHAEFGLQDMCRDVYQWAVDNPQGYERLRRLSMMATVDPIAVKKVMETVDEDLEEDEQVSVPAATAAPDFTTFIRRLSVMAINDDKFKNAARRASVINKDLGNLMEEEDDEPPTGPPSAFAWNTASPFAQSNGGWNGFAQKSS